MAKQTSSEFAPLSIALLTISDTRDENTDKSGNYLAGAIEAAGHQLYEKIIEKDDKYRIRARLSEWIANPEVQVILCTGGTGFSGRDITPEAVIPLLDKEINGFGEYFRTLSIEQVGSSTIQSRALGGLANNTFIFCLPGSVNACKTGWSGILLQQLDFRNKPCNFVELLPGMAPK